MTTKPTERDLIEEVEELLAKATPGPWVWESVGEFDGEASNAGGFTYQHIRAGYLGIADTYHSSGALWPDGSVTPPRNGNVHDANLIAATPELLRRLVERDKRNRDALKMMVELWDAEHPDDPCGCVGASDDCRHPPTCELCVARMLMEGRDPADA